MSRSPAGRTQKTAGRDAARPGSPRIRDCPCFSGLLYGQCCGPLHRAERPADTPLALMRSRYAAFALGLGEYLVRTLSEEHADRALDAMRLARKLSSARERQRFLGLRVDEVRADGDRGEVLFFARIFEKGQDRSFTERASFRRESGVWRYAGGDVEPV
jgi:SEC-C motif-containing protein